MRVLLVTPPMVQVNAPYAATPVLAGFLKAHGHEVVQLDASLELALTLFSARGVGALRRDMRRRFRGRRRIPSAVRHFLGHAAVHRVVIDAVIRFLQGRDPSLALRIAGRGYLPEGSRFVAGDEELERAFGTLGTHDLAVYLASLYLDDLADAIREGVDARFDLARYGESLAASAPTFDGLERALRRAPTLVDRLIDGIAGQAVTQHAPDVVGFTLPFPGTVYGALRMARRVKALRPDATVVVGGGYVSTELRELRDPRPFAYVDYAVTDDGEGPLLQLLESLEAARGARAGREPREGLTPAPHDRRILFRRRGRVAGAATRPIPPDVSGDSGVPDFAGLPLPRYFVMAEMLNPMHRVWSSARWNKLMLAHGCYWHRCRFCDTELDYIRRYAAPSASVLADRIEAVMAQTGQSGFHFIDEAASPGLLRRLAGELLRRRLNITWWGNVRFEAAFDRDLAELLARSGCVAVTGGLEAACDRLLAVLDKGITVGQARRAMEAFTGAGIRVHAYLMYGCPTQTEQDTVDALEAVRQLFALGVLHSAYWHRFALTVHSRFFREARAFGLRLPRLPRAAFARNEVPFRDRLNVDHAMLGRGLRKAVYNYMHGIGLDQDVRAWFERPVPAPRDASPGTQA